MEHNYDLLKPKAGTKGRSCKIKRKSMRRLMAMLLSVVLTAGTCLPAMAAEQPEIQTEEAGVTASTDIEQAAEVQPEESSNEAVTEDSSEAASSEVTVNDEETDGQAADPVDDNSENAVVTDGGDSNDNADDSDEIAGEAVTSDAAEIAQSLLTLRRSPRKKNRKVRWRLTGRIRVEILRAGILRILKLILPGLMIMILM